MFNSVQDFKNKYHVRVNRGTPQRITTLTRAVPKSPVYHFLNKTDALGPEPTDLIVNAIVEADDDMSIYVNHVTSLAIDGEKDQGYFGKKSTEERKLIQEYHKRYRQFTRVYDVDRVLEKNFPLIINYQLIEKLYPIKTRRPDTFKWLEDIVYDAIWRTATSLDTDRIQFVSIHAPRTLKPLAYYRDIIKYDRLTDIRKIKSREDLVLIDLIKYYINPNSNSIIGKYLTEESNITLTVRDDINVFYLATSDLVKWAKEEGSESEKLNWIYGLFEYLISLRPAESIDVDSLTYDDVILATKAEREEASEKVKTGEIDILVTKVANSVLPEADLLLKSGAISEAEYKGGLKLATKYQTLPNPLGEGKLVDVLSKPLPTDLVPKSTVPDLKVVVDKSVLDNKVKLLDETYITEYLEPQLLRNIVSLQKEGIIITGLKRETKEDASGKLNVYSIQTKPFKGDIGTFKIEVPVVNPDGTMRMGGVDYRMNKQRGEQPIVKLGDSTVALTSAMSKLFVQRGVRKANSYPEWLYANILNLKEHNFLTEVKVGNVANLDYELTIPDTYAILAMRFKSFTFKTFKFAFDYDKRATLATEPLKSIEKSGILVGTVPKGYLLIDETNNFYTLIGGEETLLGSLEDILGLDKSKVPVEYAEAKIKGKIVPIGVLLAYWMGLEPLMRYLDIKWDEYEGGKRIVGKEGIVLRFKDMKINTKPTTKLQELLIGGFTYFKAHLKEVNFEDMANPRTYQHLFSNRGIGVGQYTHFGRIERMWIDPITEDLLEGMGEPTDIRNLFIRAVDLLTNKQRIEEHDGAYKINKGYSRINDIVYKELMLGLTEFSRGSKTAKRKFSINPKAVRMAIAMDAGVSPVAEANPTQVIGEQERITYSGAGGRSNQSMVGRHRKFHKNDLGVISEGFTDNGKAGTILYYTANPAIQGIYGQSGKGNPVEPGNLLSNTTVINPFALKDDPKRSNFARIQLDAWANVIGQTILPCRTGAELTMAHKVGKKFALATTEAGVIKDVSEQGVIIEYTSGKEDRIKLGRSYGANAGKTIPHNMVTDRKKGYKFFAGEILAWNPYFFTRDWIEDKQVALLQGVPSFIVLRETQLVHEDGSTQSAKFAAKLQSRVTHIRDLLINYDDNVRINVKVGDDIEVNDSLGIILPVGVELTDDVTSLDYQSTTSPKAKYEGKVERVEVLYCGDLTDVSTSVKSIITKGDKARKELAEYTGEFPKGVLNDPTYIGTNYVGRNTALVRIYITGVEDFESGDKMGYMHALKTVSSKIYNTQYRTINGLEIDGDFSYKGVMARNVDSPVFQGICNMFVRQVGLNACEVYEGERK